MTRTKATYAAIFGIASLLGLESSAEAYQMVFRPAPVSVPTFRPAPTPTFRPAPTFHPAPAYRAPSFHPTFRTAPAMRFTPRTFGTSHHSSNSRISGNTGPRLARPPVNVPRVPTNGKHPGFGLNGKPPFPPHPPLHPFPHPHPRPALLYPYPWAQPGPAASQEQLAQPDQPQDNGETAQDDAAEATQDDAAQTGEEQPAEAAQDQPAQGAAEQYAQALQAQPSQTAHRRRRPAASLGRYAQGQPTQSTEEAQLTDDDTGQTMQNAPEQTADEDSGQSAQAEGQMTGEANGDSEPNDMTQE